MNRIIVALDFPTLDEANTLARSLVDDVGGFKVGMELLMAAGPGAIATIADLGKPVFADVKLHDIPNTVQRAASRVNAAGARWLTVHAAGGKAMIEAAVAGMGGSGVLAVTMLTSLDESDLATIGIPMTTANYVATLTGLASDAGAEGVVCSPAEVRMVKSEKRGITIFTPGVRPITSSTDDQRRVATARTARADGADYLVIGRPITTAPDPVEISREIAASIAPFD